MKYIINHFFTRKTMAVLVFFCLAITTIVNAQENSRNKTLVYNYRFTIPKKVKVESETIIAQIKSLPEVTDVQVYAKSEKQQGQCIVTINRILKGENAVYFSIADVKTIIEKNGLTPLALTEYESNNK